MAKKKGFFEVTVYKKYNKDKVYVNQKPKYYCKAESLVGALQGLLDEARSKNKSYIILINKHNMNGYLNLEFHNCNNNNISLYVINIKETTKDGEVLDWTDRYLMFKPMVTKQYKELINFINNNLTLYLYDYRRKIWIERSSDRYYKCLVDLNIAICSRYFDIICGSIDTRNFIATIRCETKGGSTIHFPIVKSKRLTKKMKEFIEIYNKEDIKNGNVYDT